MAGDESNGDDARPGAVFLVGMMGCGKSSVGPRLAAALGRPFSDSDARVVEKAGRSIAEIFETEGEAVFRALEREAIEESARGRAVVALGGGAIAQPGAAARLAELGQVVYLRARVETLLERVGDGRERPLLSGLGPEERRARLERLLAEREPAYETASCVVDTDGLGVDEVVARVRDELRARKTETKSR